MRHLSPAIVILFSIGLAGCGMPAGPDAVEGEAQRGPLGKAEAPGSCAADAGDPPFCGGQSAGQCWCDDLCTQYGDCCPDKQAVCDPDDAVPVGCEGNCGGQSDGACWCDDACTNYGDCCEDYVNLCIEPVDVCEALVADFVAETESIRSCTSDGQCGQALAGTSCGCTRNWVARVNADISDWTELREAAQDEGCAIPGVISTCDCPAVAGYECNAGVCSWDYI